LTGFGQRPQHVLGTIGLSLFLLGAVGLTYLTGEWAIARVFDGINHVVDPPPLHEQPLVIYAVALMLLGGQFMSIGFLAELVIAYHDPIIHSYSISDRAGGAKRDV
jgi:dolichol-phosphate mannosyltransferase